MACSSLKQELGSSKDIHLLSSTEVHGPLTEDGNGASQEGQIRTECFLECPLGFPKSSET